MRSTRLPGRMERQVVIPDRPHVVGRIGAGIAVNVDQVVNVGHDRRTALRQDPRRVERLARRQHQEVHQRIDREMIPVALWPAVTTAGQVGSDLGQSSAAREARDDCVTELSGEGLRSRADGTDVDRDRRAIEMTQLIGLESDLVGGAIERVVDLVSVQERSHHSDIFAEACDGHRALTDHAHGGVAGAESEERPSGSKSIDGRDAVRDNRGETQAGDRETGTEPHGAGPLRGEREHSKGIRHQQLRVRNPAVVITEFFSSHDEVDRVDRADKDPELHSTEPSGSGSPGWGPGASAGVLEARQDAGAALASCFGVPGARLDLAALAGAEGLRAGPRTAG